MDGEWIDEDGIPVLTQAARVNRPEPALAQAMRRHASRLHDLRFEIFGVFAGSLMAIGILTLAIR